jgi:hypothetical protein
MTTSPMDEELRCARCGDVIGVYEPMIALVEGVPRRTSKIAERERRAHVQECYHEHCYG